MTPGRLVSGRVTIAEIRLRWAGKWKVRKQTVS